MDVHGMDLRGEFWPQRISSITDDPWQASYEGRLVYDETDQALYYASASEWVKITAVGDLFNINQKIIFASTPLPDGWNIDTSVDDSIILTTTTGTQTGDSGGTWTISGMVADGSHDHFTPDNMSGPTTTAYAGASEIYTTAGSNSHKHSVPDDGSHTHDFDGLWRPVYVQFAVGVYSG